MDSEADVEAVAVVSKIAAAGAAEVTPVPRGLREGALRDCIVDEIPCEEGSGR